MTDRFSSNLITDVWGRRLEYLRISVTDRCNLRCTYCMPAEGVSCVDHRDILRYEEIIRVVKVAAGLGVRRVRITGGEPLVRKNLEELVVGLKSVPGIREVALTTNGLLLAGRAKTLAEAGIDRVNVSLDSLKPETFRNLTRGGELTDVLEGIQAAETAALRPIKVNMVVLRGINDGEIEDFVELTRERWWHVRMIELMPTNRDFTGWDRLIVPAAEVRARLSRICDLIPARPPAGAGPAVYYRVPGARGTIGFISPMSEHFCDTCNRLRLTADGKLRSCLLAGGEVDVRAILRSETRDGMLEAAFRTALRLKPRDHGVTGLSPDVGDSGSGVMSRLGG